ncbi:MAG: DUF370 domain-containing protein [Chloroflexi bacterium]|nr:MAG: hypothetical protein CUN54_06610 [Phototrophicales bacterium]RMF81433.1 MAG: DUF370 domain-containing protein [Chloroflexota bacterium]
MTRHITITPGGIIDRERIVAVMSMRSKPVQRFIGALGAERIIDMTYGYARETAILLDNGFVAITRLSVDDLTELLESTVIPEVVLNDRSTWD